MIKKHKIVIPFPTPKPAKDIKYKFGFAKPSYVNVVGSFPMKTMIKESGGNNVDFVVQIPSVCTSSSRIAPSLSQYFKLFIMLIF